MRRQDGRDPNRSVSYRKQVTEISTGAKIKEGFLSFGEPFYYYRFKFVHSFVGAVNSVQNIVTSNPDTIYYILGKRIVGFDNASNFYLKIIWFSYRNVSGLGMNFPSDTGWGCLIRVGQMVMAASIKRFLLNKNTDAITESKIIVSFIENNGSKEEKYSLKKIVERAKTKNNKIDYGEWFTCGTVCRVLSDLHRKDRMNGTENLEFHLFEQQTILISEILEKLGKNECSCLKKKILCEICYNEDSSVFKEERKPLETYTSTMFQENIKKRETISKNKNDLPFSQEQSKIKTKEKEKAVVIFVICQLWFENVDKKAIEQVKGLFELESSLGALGGVKDKGLYITGFAENNFIYVDPHLTQHKVEVRNLARELKTFYPEVLRRKDFGDLDPSIAFAFYIDGLQSLRKLQEKTEELKERYEYPIIQMEWDNNYLRNSVCAMSEVDPREFNEDNDLENSFIDEQ